MRNIKIHYLFLLVLLSFCSSGNSDNSQELLKETTTSLSTTTTVEAPKQESTTSTSTTSPQCQGDNNQNIDFSRLKNVQNFLNRYGFNAGEEDGYLGNQTLNAIRDFQRFAGLYPDGDVGPATISVMKKWTGCENEATSTLNTTTTTIAQSDDESTGITSTTTTTSTTLPNNSILISSNEYGYIPSVSLIDNSVQTILKGVSNPNSICGTPYLRTLDSNVRNQFENGNNDFKNILDNKFISSTSITEINSITNDQITIHVEGNGDESFNFYFIEPFTSKIINLEPTSITISSGLTKAIFSKENLKRGYWFYSFAENGSGEIVKSSGLREFAVNPSINQFADSQENIESVFITKNNQNIAYGQGLSVNDKITISYLTDKVFDNKNNTNSLIESDDKLITLINENQADEADILLIDKELVLVTSKDGNKYTIERGYLNTIPKDHEAGVSVKKIKPINESTIISYFAYAIFRNEEGLRFQVPLGKELHEKTFDLLGCPNGRYSLEEVTTFAWRQQGSSVVSKSTNKNINSALLNKEFVITDSPIDYIEPTLKGTDTNSGTFSNDGPRNTTVNVGGSVSFNFDGLNSNSSIIRFVKLNFQMIPTDNAKLSKTKSVFQTIKNNNYSIVINFESFVNSSSPSRTVWERGYKYIFTGIEVFDDYSKTSFLNDGTIKYDSNRAQDQHDAYYFDQFSFLVPNE